MREILEGLVVVWLFIIIILFIVGVGQNNFLYVVSSLIGLAIATYLVNRKVKGGYTK